MTNSTVAPDPLLEHPIAFNTKLFLGCYYILILTLCWCGNIFTLYATIKHNAIKLDKLSVWIIQNLAVADILHGWTHVLPVIVATFSGYNLIHICKPLLTVKYVFIDANSFLINALVFNKLYRCKFPFRTPPTVRTRIFLTICAGLSGCLYASVTIIKVTHTETASFTENYFGCEADSPMPAKYNTLDLIMTCIVLVIPVCTLMVANSALLFIAVGKGMNMPATREKIAHSNERRKSILTAQINRRSFIIIGATTMVYTLAQLPYLYFCFELYGITNTLEGLTLVRFARFSFVIMQSSCFVNPIIYCMTNRGFRAFTLHCIYRALGKKSMDMERRCSLPALSVSRGDSRICSSILVDSSRYRTSPVRGDRLSVACDRQLQTKNSVIFNTRAYGYSPAVRSGSTGQEFDSNGHHDSQSNGNRSNGKSVSYLQEEPDE